MHKKNETPILEDVTVGDLIGALSELDPKTRIRAWLPGQHMHLSLPTMKDKDGGVLLECNTVEGF